MQNILSQFGLEEADFIIQPFGSGLINRTWQIQSRQGDEKFILQRINDGIFKRPEDIASNIRQIGNYLEVNHPDYLFVHPCISMDGTGMVKTADGYFRLFPFIPGSHTVNVVENPRQAFEAAKQFGKFTKLLSGLNIEGLKITLPDFHNLPLRYQQFEEAVRHGHKERIMNAADLISFARQNENIVVEYEMIKTNFKTRCTHHDTKISNVLFDKQDKGLCVIDLDTVMPGYFISDVGDMMRTYVCPVSEEENDFSKIIVRKDFYDAIINGYLAEMGAELSDDEKKYFHYSGRFMIYMQAIRFLTDHINNDIYYGAKYPGHNLVRAGNQSMLLQRYMEINPG